MAESTCAVDITSKLIETVLVCDEVSTRGTPSLNADAALHVVALSHT